MKTSNLTQILAVFFTLVMIGCSSDAGGGGAFIPTFNATWEVDGTDGSYRMDLQPNEANKNVESGVFNGEEQHDDDDDLDNNPLSGSFNGLDIKYTIKRDNHVNIEYKGKMIPISDENHSIIRIDLSSSEGNIVLVPL